MEVVDEVLLPILGGRALARLKCTCKTFSDQIHNDHVAWLGGVSNPPAGPNARARFLDRLSDTCSSCGAETDITKALSYSRQYFCSSCMFRHANRVRDLGNFDRALAMRVMQLNIAIRRRELDPIFAGATKACAEFQGRPMAPARLLFSTRYDGQALCMFFGLTAGKQNTLLIMDTTCGHYLGAFVPEAWKNFGDKAYGSKQTSLFSSYPQLNFFPASRDVEGYQVSSKSGIVLGPSISQATVFVNSNLDQGWTLPSATFRNPALLPEREFRLKNLEVWQLSEDTGEEPGEEAEEYDDPFEDDFAKFRKKKKDSVLKNGVERFMLSFVGAGNALSVAMHMRNHT